LLKEELRILNDLVETPRRKAVRGPFHQSFHLNQPEEQIGGVRETTGNYLQYFLTPEVAEVFCTGTSTFDFRRLIKAKSSS
jgi:type IV secretory pathway TraG/TraD family ATPase VirD4